MNEELKEKLKRYAELKSIEKDTKKQIEELNPVIKEFLIESKVDKLPTSLGNFTLTPFPVWKYSEAVEKAEEVVEELKAKEKADGTAKATYRQDLKFTAPKANKDE